MPAKTQTTITKKEVRELLDRRFDKVTFHKDGSITVKQYYFYTHGQSPDTVAAKVEATFPDHTVQIELAHDDFQQWPKKSYFVVKFRLLGMGK